MQVDVKISEVSLPAIFKKGFFFQEQLLPVRPGWAVSVRVLFDPEEKAILNALNWHDRRIYHRYVSDNTFFESWEEYEYYWIGANTMYVRDGLTGQWFDLKPPAPSLEEANHLEKGFLSDVRYLKTQIKSHDGNSPRTKSYDF